MTASEYLKSDFIFASKTFLCKELPNDYDQWDDKKLGEFIEVNAWQPFENDDPSDIWDHIDALAEDVRNYIKEQNS